MEMYIADNLRFLRERSGYTLEALSEILGVSRQTVSKWEMGTTYPNIENILKLTQLYRTTIDKLVCLDMSSSDSEHFDGAEGKLFRILEISDNGEIKLPESLFTMFDIKKHDKLLLLADTERGIALVKNQELY